MVEVLKGESADMCAGKFQILGASMAKMVQIGHSNEGVHFSKDVVP
jgi:hypothetical protein